MTAPGYVQSYPANPVYGGGYPSNRPPAPPALPPRQPSEGGWKMSTRRPPMQMSMPVPQQHPSRPPNQMYPQQQHQYPSMPSPSHSMPYPPPQHLPINRPDVATYPLHPPISPGFPQTMDHQRPSPVEPVSPLHSYPPPATPTHIQHHPHHSMYPPPISTNPMLPHDHSQSDTDLVSSPLYPPPSSSSSTMAITTTTTTCTTARPPPPPLPPRMTMPMPTPSRNGHRYQAFQPQVAYPPPGYFRPPSQDFISRFRSSTVQSFQSSAPPASTTVEQAEEELEEALKSTLRRFDSGKYTTSSSDTSDDEEEEQYDDDDTVATTPTQSSMKKLQEKPLPPTPPAAASRSTPPPPPIPALLSSVSRSFALQMKQVVSLRQLSFSNEYPNAFTGQEAVVSQFHECIKIKMLTCRVRIPCWICCRINCQIKSTCENIV